MTVNEIALLLNSSAKTIQKYLNPSYSVENKHYHARIPGKLPL